MVEAAREGLLPLIVLVLRGWRYQIACGRLWVFQPDAWVAGRDAPVLLD